MASEIRVDKITHTAGVGTITPSPTGVHIAGIVTGTTFSGSGASLTNLPAANVTGTLPAISGANLTNLPAANITGTLPAISAENLTSIPAANITGTLPAISAANLTSIPAANITGTLPAISAENLTSIPAANVTGTLPAISAANLTNVPAANITGTLPAIDGSNLTGIGGGITHARVYRLTSTYTLSAYNADLTANWEYDDDATDGYLGSGWSLPSSGIFSFPATGIYEVRSHSMFYTGGGSNTPYAGIALQGTTNNSSYSSRAAAYSSQSDDLNAARYHNVHASAIFDVTNTSNIKFKITTFHDANYNDVAFMGDTNDNYTYVEVIRLGDT